MLNTFPELFTYSTFAAALIRLVVGLTLIYIAYAQFKRRKTIIEEVHRSVGWRVDQTLIAIAALVVFAVGLAIVLGWHTQVAAIIAIIFMLKQFVIAKRYPAAAPLCRLDYFYLIVMLLTLLVTGAGPFGFDYQML